MPVAPISHSRRAISVAAPLALFALSVGFAGRGIGTQAQSTWLVVSCAYVAVPALVVGCLCVSGARSLARLDVVTLVTGLVLSLASFRGTMSRTLVASQTDESLLDRLAARALIAGHDPYVEHFRQVAGDGRGTPLFSGHSVGRFAYPPLPVELTWLLHHLDTGITSPAFVDVLAVVVLGCAAFFAVPAGWRPLVVVVLFGLGPERGAVLSGEGVVLAAALLCGASYRWTSTGRDGRLGWTGLLRAVLVGLACASYQLAWVLSVFLVIGIVELRRAEIGTARALAVGTRYVLAAGAAFVLVNLPFIVDDAPAWGSALVSVFTQRAIVFGQGWGLALVLVRGGSAGIELMTVATVVLVAVLVVLFVAGFGRLAPALPVLATLCFALSTRTSGEYVWGFWPVWVVGAATIDRELVRTVATGRAPRWARLSDRRLRVGAAIVLLAVPLTIFLVGVTTPSPLVVRVAAVQVTAQGRVAAVRLTVRNDTDHAVDVAYYVDHRDSITDRWAVQHGRTPVGPRTRQSVDLLRDKARPAPAVASGLWVVATLPDPEAMTATPLAARHEKVEVVGPLSRGVSRSAVARCWAAVLGGDHRSCTERLLTGPIGDVEPLGSVGQ